MPKQYSYQGHPVTVVVKIHNRDVTDAIAAVADIVRGIDYPNLTAFRVGEASFTLRDVHGDFSPNNPSNFFTQNGGHRTGYNSPVEIAAGFIVDGVIHTETIFKGNIIRLVQDAKGATVKVVCTDNFGDMRTNAITDFGVPRHFMLTEDRSQSAENGVYPIMDAVMPASEGSVSLATRTGETIKPVQKLATEGTLSPRNFVIDEQGVKTEGGRIVNRQVGYPQLRMKSPYRYRHIEDVIADVLADAGITQSEISIPERDANSHFSSNGRVNYDLIGNIGSSNPVTWNGYVTDYLHDANADTFYFLYNGGRNNPNGISQIITYAVATRTWSQLHKFTAGTEVWKCTKTGNDFYVVASTGGSYDADVDGCKTRIIKVAFTGTPPTGTETVFVADAVRLQPQLATYYHGVGSVFMKPDARRQIVYRANDGLYYVYCDNQNDKFGIAKATQGSQTSVIEINQDGYGNHAGLAFTINASGVLKGGSTFVSGRISQTLAFKKAL